MASESYKLFLSIASENAHFLDIALDDFEEYTAPPATPADIEAHKVARLQRRADFLDAALDDMKTGDSSGLRTPRPAASGGLRTPSRSPRRTPRREPRVAPGGSRSSASTKSSQRPAKVVLPPDVEIIDDDDEPVFEDEAIDLSIKDADTEASDNEATDLAATVDPTVPADDSDNCDLDNDVIPRGPSDDSEHNIPEVEPGPPWRRADKAPLPPPQGRPSQAPSLVFPLGCVSGRRDHVGSYEQVLLRAEASVAKAYGIPWALRGPPPPPPGPDRFWRGQAHRDGSSGGKARWANRGGQHQEFYANLARQNRLPKTLGGDSISLTQRFASRLNVVFNQRLKLRTVQKHDCANS
jgi:hypothetical protein